MNKCRNCKKDMVEGFMLACPNCGATFCSACAVGTQNICPYCYSSLEYFG